jgi:energy-coupling factor transport system substrate-specific component
VTHPASDVRAIRFHAGAAAALALASLVTLAAFGWPFLLDPSGGSEGAAHGSDAPWVFALVLPLLAAIVLAELNAGGIDAKAIALLGMLASVGGALRALSPGVAGLEPAFVVIILGGRVFGRGFGFVLGCLTLFVGALLTGGVGPWLPFQMMAAGWVGFLSGCLPRVGGRAEVRMLAVLGFALGLVYGALMNLWFWPFGVYGEGQTFVPGGDPAENLTSYARYYVITSAIWDLARGTSTFLLLLLAGGPLLRALRRVSRLAHFEAAPVFVPPPETPETVGPR